METTNYFIDCNSLEEAKKLYRKLVKQYHPDVNPNGEETTKLIVNAYDKYIKSFYTKGAESFFKEKGWKAQDLTPFTDILEKVVHFDIDLEIIGYWIYAFNAYEYKEQLKDSGFFFSKKHKAWIYSGTKKKTRYSTKNTTDDNRSQWGYSKVNRETQEKISV